MYIQGALPLEGKPSSWCSRINVTPYTSATLDLPFYFPQPSDAPSSFHQFPVQCCHFLFEVSDSLPLPHAHGMLLHIVWSIKSDHPAPAAQLSSSRLTSAQVTVSRDSRLVAASYAAPALVVERSPAAAGGAAAGFDWGTFSRTATDEV